MCSTNEMLASQEADVWPQLITLSMLPVVGLSFPLDPYQVSMISDFGNGGMSRNIHSEAEVIAALRQVEAGRKVEDVARELGVSEHTIYG